MGMTIGMGRDGWATRAGIVEGELNPSFGGPGGGARRGL